MGKKGKKGKKDEKPPDEVNEYETMDLEMLREVVPLLKQTLAKKSLDRNYVQLERDALQQFYDISRSEVEDVKGEIAKKDRDMELMEDKKSHSGVRNLYYAGHDTVTSHVSHVPRDPGHESLTTRTPDTSFYQWVPFILVFQVKSRLTTAGAK